MSEGINFFWFRRDLRLHDNAGLYEALSMGKPVQCVFIFDKNILDQLENPNDARVSFIYDQIKDLNTALATFGSSLLVSYNYPLKAWQQWSKEYNINAVFTNTDYEPYAIKRDFEVNEFLSNHKILLHTFKDHVLFEKNEVIKDDGKPYSVFTPYKNKHVKLLNSESIKIKNTKRLFKFFIKNPTTEIFPIKRIGFTYNNINYPSKEIKNKLLSVYEQNRDFPAIKGTSRLSVHLRFGTISIRELAKIALQQNSVVFLNELIWRDFYQMILWHHPYVANRSFKKEYDSIIWRNNISEFEMWCKGETGYPIVDAGMRELNSTGFMHNRVRMITASFLVKHLLVDWRWGEAYFANKLLDFDLASNNGGWQWAAGSGCDAAPYFRIFNPYTQTEKFDPERKYIRKWVPEFESSSYPAPIVDHKIARERCLTVYKKALKKF